MGLTVQLREEDGRVLREVHDPRNHLHRLFEKVKTARPGAFIPYIDWYGLTLFNQLQMEPFLDEWSKLRATDPEAEKLVRQVQAMGTEVRKGPHLYLAFVGD